MTGPLGYTIIPNGSREESVICCKCHLPFQEGQMVVTRPMDPFPMAQMISHHKEPCPTPQPERHL